MSQSVAVVGVAAEAVVGGFESAAGVDVGAGAGFGPGFGSATENAAGDDSRADCSLRQARTRPAGLLGPKRAAAGALARQNPT